MPNYLFNRPLTKPSDTANLARKNAFKMLMYFLYTPLFQPFFRATLTRLTRFRKRSNKRVKEGL